MERGTLVVNLNSRVSGIKKAVREIAPNHRNGRYEGVLDFMTINNLKVNAARAMTMCLHVVTLNILVIRVFSIKIFMRVKP